MLAAIYTSLIVWVAGLTLVYPRALHDAIGIALIAAALALQFLRRETAAAKA